ncbi:MAG: pyridoxal kinase PdxY [Alphaproteobacteria bacterium]|jgi:pyridoxine kinase
MTSTKNVLSIQSSVAYGHVGNNAATLPLQRLGIGVWPVHTTHLSNHLGHPTWRGGAADTAMVSDVVAGIAELGVLGECDALLSGYLGSAALGAVVLEALDALRAVNSRALFALDPVIGDDGIGVYVADGVAEFLRDQLLPRADIATPNRFELEIFTGRKISAIDDALAAMAELRDQGPGLVVLTSAPGGDQGELTTLASDGEDTWMVRSPRLETAVHGTGDMFSALFLGHTLRCAALEDALSLAVSSIHAVLTATSNAGAREMLLVETQDALAAPPTVFAAEKLA